MVVLDASLQQRLIFCGGLHGGEELCP